MSADRCTRRPWDRDRSYPRPPWPSPSATSRQAAPATTVEVLAEVGYGRLTTAAVAKRLDVSTATLDRYWQSKDALVTEALSSLVAEIRIPDRDGVRSDPMSLMQTPCGCTRRRSLRGRCGA
jgi:AcrR family transcriptional regulator